MQIKLDFFKLVCYNITYQNKNKEGALYMNTCCERYTDTDTKRCMLCGCHSVKDDDFQASIEYLNLNQNKKGD